MTKKRLDFFFLIIYAIVKKKKKNFIGLEHTNMLRVKFEIFMCQQ